MTVASTCIVSIMLAFKQVEVALPYAQGKLLERALVLPQRWGLSVDAPKWRCDTYGQFPY
eukprot:3721992-Heterocapsa_arctica.AAC.1